MSTKDVLNTRFHHVGFSWRIYSSKPMKYDIKENNNPDWLNKGPRYNIAKMLGLNSFIKIMKLVKNVSWSYEKVVQTNTNYEIQITYSG